MSDSATNTFATPRAAAGALFTDDEGRVLMLRPTYKKSWDIPGGYIETGEAPTEACAREIREELNLDITVGALLVADWAPHPDEGDKILFVFDGGRLDRGQLERIQFADGEIAEWRFVDAEELDQLTTPRLARRIRSALDARQQGRTLYLQNGGVLV